MEVKPVSTLTEFKELVGLSCHHRAPDPQAHSQSPLPRPVDYQINGDKIVIFDFWATWCGPCRVISPVFEKFAQQFSTIGFYKVDVDAAQDIAQEVGVRAVSVTFPESRLRL